MIVLDCQQGSPEWFAARLAKPTASMFDKIITPTGKPSTQAEGYANQLLAEWITGEQQGFEGNQWTERGTELEPQARAYYEMEKDCEVSQVGFVLRDDGLVGCSPDGLVADSGLLEIKCPAPHTHIEYLIGGGVPTKYHPQTQGQLLITERDWLDFISYHPSMPPVLVRVTRDDAFIKALSSELDKFLAMMEKKRDILKSNGIGPIWSEK